MSKALGSNLSATKRKAKLKLIELRGKGESKEEMSYTKKTKDLVKEGKYIYSKQHENVAS